MKKLLLLVLFAIAFNAASAQDYIFKKFSDHFSISKDGSGINIYGNDIKDNLGNYFLKANSPSLQSFIDSLRGTFVPYTGATADVNLGNHGISSTAGSAYGSTNGLTGSSRRSVSIGHNVGGGTPSVDLYSGIEYSSYRYDKLLYSDGTNAMYITRPPLTAAVRSIMWPDASGTVALTSDLSGLPSDNNVLHLTSANGNNETVSHPTTFSAGAVFTGTAQINGGNLVMGANIDMQGHVIMETSSVNFLDSYGGTNHMTMQNFGGEIEFKNTTHTSGFSTANDQLYSLGGVPYLKAGGTGAGALDSGVVHKNGLETIIGGKIFKSDINLDRTGDYSNIIASRGLVLRSSAFGNQLAWTSAGLFYNNPDNTMPFTIPIATGRVTVPQITISNAPATATDAVRLGDLAGYSADANVVHLAGAETITGSKAFTNSVQINNGLNLVNGNLQMNKGVVGGASRYDLTDAYEDPTKTLQIRNFGGGVQIGTTTAGIVVDPTTNRIYTSGSGGAGGPGQQYALVSDLPATSGFVPYTGATGDVILGSHGITAQGFTTTSFGGGTITATGNGITSTNSFNIQSANTVNLVSTNQMGFKSVNDDQITFTNNAETRSINFIPNSNGFYFSAAGFRQNVTFATPTLTRNIVFPDASGTVALTSDLASIPTDANLVHKTGTETIAGDKTFSSNLDFTNGPTIHFDNPSLTGKVLKVDGNGYLTGLAYTPVSPGDLDGYLPYTGATSNLNLGAHDLTATGLTALGTTNFQAGLEVFNGIGGGNVLLHLGQKLSYQQIRYSTNIYSGAVDDNTWQLGKNGNLISLSGDILHNSVGVSYALITDIPNSTGTVTSVSSANSDIAIASGTSTPVLTLNNVNGITKSYYDPTSSIQTQLNSKQAGLSGTGFVKASGSTISYDNTAYLPLTGGTITNTTTPQLTLSYDATHSLAFTMSSAGVATVTTSGNSFSFGSSIVRANTLSNTSTGNNSMMALGTAGATISSNKANADPVLTVNNLNTSSTGLLEKWQFNSVNVATLDKTGLFTPSAIGAAVNVTTQAPGTNNTTIASMAAVFAERTNTAILTNKTLTTPKLTGYTVATLPAGSIGMEAYVTDAVAPTYLGALTGGGTVVTPVFHNGTAWVAH